MANNRVKIKAIAFDFDGVITNLDINWDEAIRMASKIAGYNVQSLLLFYDKNFGSSLFLKVSDEIEKLEINAVKKASLTPHVEEFLQKIKNSKVDAYVVSMQSLTAIKTFLDEHNLTSFFKDIISRERCPNKKAQVEWIIKNVNIKPEQVLLIDDAKKNITVCKEAGIQCFLFPRKKSADQTLQAWNKILEST